jgi:hypothetical protein
MLTLLFILLQLVVSAKPGLVDIATGETNVRQYEYVSSGTTIRTGADGHVEVALGWNASLRLNENTSAILDFADRTAVAVQIDSGSGLVEISQINKGDRIMVTAGRLKTVIDAKGIYRFSENTASVIEGKLKTADNSTEVESDWQIKANAGVYQKAKTNSSIASEFKRFMGSPVSGFVNAVHGQVNLPLHDRARKGAAVQTGTRSHVELLLAPGSFLRLAENSSVVFESNSVNNTVVRIMSGSALLEADVIEPRLPVRVIVGARKVRIESAGLYRLTAETAAVIAGALHIELEKDNMEYGIGKGRQVTATSSSYQETSISSDDQNYDLDRWSADRSYQLAAANFMAHYGDSRPNFFLFQSRSPNNAAWIFSPILNAFTFIPRQRHDSYYKEAFVPLYVYLPPPALPTAPVFPDFPMPRRSGFPGAILSAPPSGPPAPSAEPAPSPAPAPAPASTPAPAPNTP